MWQRHNDTPGPLLGLADDENRIKQGPKELKEEESSASIRRLFGDFWAFDRDEETFDWDLTTQKNKKK